jgi:multidrug efflux pump subunit AcrA (membrane-fusion protein)
MNYILTSFICACILYSGVFISNTYALEGESTALQPTTYTVTGNGVGSVVRLGGSVVPRNIVSLNAQMPGGVKFVAGSEGDVFSKGDILISLDIKSLLAKREQAMSQLASADAGYRNAQVQYNQELVNPNSQSNSMLGGAPALFNVFSNPTRSMMGQGSPEVERSSNLYAHGTQIETARNSVNQARAALRELDESLRNANSYAPFDGVILKKMVERGDIVQPGMPLISFADITRLQILVEIPTRLLKVIKVGSQVYAQLDGEQVPVPILVERIFPMANASGHTTTVKLSLPQNIRAQSGMYAEIILPEPDNINSALPVIPQSAIIWRGSLPAVYVVGNDGRQKLRLIRVDEVAFNGMVSVISGIKIGDKVLVRTSSTTPITR